jgi:hypothetical protein
MQTPHDANNTMFTRGVRHETSAFLPPGNGTHQDQITSLRPVLAEKVQCEAGGDEWSFEVHVSASSSGLCHIKAPKPKKVKEKRKEKDHTSQQY